MSLILHKLCFNYLSSDNKSTKIDTWNFEQES